MEGCYQQVPGLGRSVFKPQLSHLLPGNLAQVSASAKYKRGQSHISCGMLKE